MKNWSNDTSLLRPGTLIYFGTTAERRDIVLAEQRGDPPEVYSTRVWFLKKISDDDRKRLSAQGLSRAGFELIDHRFSLEERKRFGRLSERGNIDSEIFDSTRPAMLLGRCRWVDDYGQSPDEDSVWLALLKEKFLVFHEAGLPRCCCWPVEEDVNQKKKEMEEEGGGGGQDEPG